MFGEPEMDQQRLSQISKELGIVVTSTDYRLAPENPYPSGIEDAYASLKWVHENAGMICNSIFFLVIYYGFSLTLFVFTYILLSN